MVKLKQAIDIIKNNLPNGNIQKCVDYKNFYLFMVFLPDPYEGQMDAIYSVSKESGEFRDFNYLQQGVFGEVMRLFAKADKFK